MFTLVSGHETQKLGIEIHKLTTYRFDHGLLSGSLVHDSTTKDFCLLVTPNLERMKQIAQARPDLPLAMEFDRARTHTIGAGIFREKDEAAETVSSLEHWYQIILKERGARKRHLVEQKGELSLALSESANDLRYGEAILQAINARVFAMLDSQEDIDHRNVAGRIIPAYMQALGFKEYYVNHDLSKDGFGKVRFVVEGHYAFEIYEPLKEGRPAFIERYGYRRGHYVLDSSCELNVPNLKNSVLGFLEELAKDLGYFDKRNPAAAARETAMNVRPCEVVLLGATAERPVILGLNAPLPRATVHTLRPRPH